MGGAQAPSGRSQVRVAGAQSGGRDPLEPGDGAGATESRPCRTASIENQDRGTPHARDGIRSYADRNKRQINPWDDLGLPPENAKSADGHSLPELTALRVAIFDRAGPKLLRLTGHTARRKSDRTEQFVWDKELPGFGLRIYATGKKRWIVQLRQRGRTRRLTLGDPKNIGAPEAREAARKWLAENALEGLPQRRPPAVRENPRFDNYVDEFWRDYSGHWKPATQKRAMQSIRRVLVPAFGDRQVGSIMRADVLAWRDTRRDTPASFHMELAALSAMLGYAEKLGYRRKGSNPCRGVPRFKTQLRERYLSAREYRRLHQVLGELASQYPDAVAAIRLLMFTGARRSEIAGLHWEWIDPPYANLPDSKTGPKRLYLNRQAIAVLDTRRGKSEGPIFPELTGHPRLLDLPWSKIRRRAAIPDVRLHDLRHSFASVAIMSGISLIRIGKLLGHVLPETTARYAHLSDVVIADAAQRVSASIASSLGMRL